MNREKRPKRALSWLREIVGCDFDENVSCKRLNIYDVHTIYNVGMNQRGIVKTVFVYNSLLILVDIRVYVAFQSV